MMTVRCFLLVLAGAVLATPAMAEDAARTVGIYQQRTADGRIVLTDRPAEGAAIERSWQITREDAAAGRSRAEQMRLEARLVSDRIQQRVQQQQADVERLELARRWAALAQTRRDAELARPAELEAPVLLLPRALSRQWVRHPPGRAERPPGR